MSNPSFHRLFSPSFQLHPAWTVLGLILMAESIHASCFLNYIRQHMETIAVRRPLHFRRVDPLAVLFSVSRRGFPRADQSGTDGILSVLFSSLRCLIQAVRTQEGMALLKAYLDREVADKVALFLQQDVAIT
ncbi:hypothetical protein NUU61_000183 [Penicillium alfredii]|uniref:Uncharacterized protein n=1 Tax=Penicillium alfredii TaxID=1506179 RepID=A0A9W9G9H6_9EURO|nr:uncharacterized protein NUU61_000183 [Penicillium alfredii]KAJ5114424.1 hypothetical protein NUU61_000183 [Penicillium alfredii]